MSHPDLLLSEDRNHQNILKIYEAMLLKKPEKRQHSTEIIVAENECGTLDKNFKEVFMLAPSSRYTMPNTLAANQLVPETRPVRSDLVSIRQFSDIHEMASFLSNLKWNIVNHQPSMLKRFNALCKEIASSSCQPPCIDGKMYVYSPTLLTPISTDENITINVSWSSSGPAVDSTVVSNDSIVSMAVVVPVNASVNHLLHHVLLNMSTKLRERSADHCLLCVHGQYEILPRDVQLNELRHIRWCIRLSTPVWLDLIVLDNPLSCTQNNICVSGNLFKVTTPTSNLAFEKTTDKLHVILEAIRNEFAFLSKLEGISGVSMNVGISDIEILGHILARTVQLTKNVLIALRMSSRVLDSNLRQLSFLSRQCRSDTVQSRGQLAFASVHQLYNTVEVLSRFFNAYFDSFQFEKCSVVEHIKNSCEVSKKVKIQLPEVRGFLNVTVYACYYDKFYQDYNPADQSSSGLAVYSISAVLCYNGNIISKRLNTRWMSFDSNTLMPHRIVFDEQLSFDDINACVFPRETVVLFQLWRGRLAAKDHSDEPDSQISVAWASQSLFNNAELAFVGNVAISGPNHKSADIFLGLHSSAICNRPLITSTCCDVLSPFCPIITVELKIGDTVAPIYFPKISARPDIILFDFESLNEDTKARLRSVLRKSNFITRSPAEEALLWERRHYLTDFPGALPKVLRATSNWDCLSLHDTYRLLKEWRQLSPSESIELLLPRFSDVFVRSIAVQSLKTLPVDNLDLFLPQLVRAWAFDFEPCSDLAHLLLYSAATSPIFAHSLLWQLRQLISVEDDASKYRYMLLAQAMYIVCCPAVIEEFKKQNQLVIDLDKLDKQLKQDKSLLNVEVVKLSESLTRCSVRLPLKFSFVTNGVDVNECSVFSSLRSPVKLVFANNIQSNQLALRPTFEALYKVGDDITQDIVALQLLSVMDMIWQIGGLDLGLLVFNCVQTGNKRGMIQIITESSSLREIQVRFGLTGSFKSRAIDDWLKLYNTTEEDYQRAVMNFTLSCAAYCVATFVLGVGDRHNDNIMLRRTGHLFHIDFGKYLGDAEMFGSFKRDRTAFVFTSDMAYVIYGKYQSNKKYQDFVNICCTAFNLLRQHSNVLLTLLVMLQDFGIASITAEGVQFVKDVLRPDETDEESSNRFTTFLARSLQSRWTQFNFFLHNIAQYKSGLAIKQQANTSNRKITRSMNARSESSATFITGEAHQTKVHRPKSSSLYGMGLGKPTKTDKALVLTDIRLKGNVWCEDDSRYYLSFYVILQNKHSHVASSQKIYRTYEQLYLLCVKLKAKHPLIPFRSLPPASWYTSPSIKIRSESLPQIMAVSDFCRSLCGAFKNLNQNEIIRSFFQQSELDTEMIISPSKRSQIYEFKDDGTVTERGIPVKTSPLHQVADCGQSIKSPTHDMPKLKVSFSHSDEILYVLVMYARNLTAKSAVVPSTCVELHLCPPDADKSPVRSTRVVNRSVNPSYHDLFMYRITRTDVIQKKMMVNIRSVDPSVNGSMQHPILFVGQFSLSKVEIDGSSSPQWINLIAAPILSIE